ESQQRCESLIVMLSVNNVGWFGKGAQAIDDRHGCCAQLFGNSAQSRTVGDRSMAAAHQFNSDVANVELTPCPSVQGVVREQYSHPSTPESNVASILSNLRWGTAKLPLTRTPAARLRITTAPRLTNAFSPMRRF